VNNSCHVLHITAHLGGGVGKALSGLVLQAASAKSNVKHTVITLEKQEKSQFIDLIKECGCEVDVCPKPERISELIMTADVLQLEWWNHPVTINALCSQPLPPMRLLVWSHVSGLFNPIIPSGLLLAAHKFLFTSACSFEAREVKSLPNEVTARMDVVSSSGGFDGLPQPGTQVNRKLVVGYIGSLNFSKLHPRYVDFLSAVNIPNFCVRLIGDVTNSDVLEMQCKRAGKLGMLDFRGYTNSIASELASINVLAYLLNPEHYGTTENALIEAMAMGIVPIVLDNPAERQIVENHRTGLVVSTPKEFAEAVSWLSRNPTKRHMIGRQAAETVRSKFSANKTVTSLNDHYRKLLSVSKQRISFTDIFGTEPADWFLSSQGNQSYFVSANRVAPDPDSYSIHALLEETKGTAYHFHKYFPDDIRLNQWASMLNSQKKAVWEYLRRSGTEVF